MEVISISYLRLCPQEASCALAIEESGSGKMACSLSSSFITHFALVYEVQGRFMVEIM